MKLSIASDRHHCRQGFYSVFACGLLFCAVIAAWGSSAFAQSPAPTASPASTVAPSPDPTPVPTPTPVPVDLPPTAPSPTGDAPQMTVTPGTPDAATEANNIAARTPQVSVVLSNQSSGLTSSALSRSLAAGRAQAAANPDSTIHPKSFGGAFTQVLLVPTQAGTRPKTSKAPTNTTSSAAATPVPLAVVTLDYGAAWAGQLVFARPLTDGTILATDGSGNVTTATADGFLLTLDATGIASFGFQAPSASKTYQVYTRLDNAASTLTFTVPDDNL